MGQMIFCDIKKKRTTGDKATSISAPSEPSCDYDENLIDKVSSASYGAGLDLQQSQISGDVQNEVTPITKGYHYSGFTEAKSSPITGVGPDETDDNAIDKVSSASYAAGIQCENEEEFVDYERKNILADCQKLSLMAKFYLRPELPVVTTDPTVTARCYFDRPSATSSVIDKSNTFFSNRVQSNASADPFDLDEDIIPISDATNIASSPSTQEVDEAPLSKPDEEGKLSRSPSCVRLI